MCRCREDRRGECKVVLGVFFGSRRTVFEHAGRCLKVKKEVEYSAKKGKSQNQKQPRKFVCRTSFLGDDVKSNKDAQKTEKRRKILRESASADDEIHQKAELHKYKQPDENSSVE